MPTVQEIHLAVARLEKRHVEAEIPMETFELKRAPPPPLPLA